MSDFINKVVSIILLFMLLVLAPILIYYASDAMVAKREILNDTSSFIDQIIDTKEIDKDTLNKFYIECNSHGIAVDVVVNKMLRTMVPDTTGSKVVYYSTTISDEAKFNSGDILKVDITEAGISTSRKLGYNILRIDRGPFKLTLAGEVR